MIDQDIDLIGNVTEGVGSAGKGVGSIVENMGSLGSNIVKGVDTVADGFGLGAPVAAGVAAGVYGAKKLGLGKLVGKNLER